MKLVHQDRKLNLIKLVPQVLDDLYHLAQLVEPGDRVGSVTFRTPELTDDVERRGKLEKKRMYLVLEVTDVEFHEFSDRLRIHGTIAEGPQDLGSHHTFNVEADGQTDIKIIKPGGWKKHHLDRVKEAQEQAKQPRLYILAVEEDEATLAEVRAYGAREVATKRSSGHGKMFSAKKQDNKGGDFMDEVMELVTASRDPSAPLIVVGPGWTRERVVDELRKHHREHGKDLLTEGTGQAGMVGVHEAIKRGLVERVVKDHAIARDTALFEQVLTEIAKDTGLAAYGPEDTRRALQMGAVETLLVTDVMVRTHKVDKELALAEKAGSHVHVLAETHEAGERLRGFGGIAALLRFAIGE